MGNDKVHFPFVHHFCRFEVDDFKSFKSRFGIKWTHIKFGVEFVQKVCLCHRQCGKQQKKSGQLFHHRFVSFKDSELRIGVQPSP